MNKLQPSDSRRFAILDILVKKGLSEAAKALTEIKEKELWRAGSHKTFKDYCESIGRSYSWAWQQIKNGKESIAVPQRRVTLPERSESRKSPERDSKPATVIPERKLPTSTAKDETGIEIPPEIQEFWNRNQEVTTLLGMISKVRIAIENGQGEGDKLFRGVDHQTCISRLHMVYEELQCAKSYAVCPDCNGVMFEDCSTCKGRGTLSKFSWGMIDERKKAMRK